MEHHVDLRVRAIANSEKLLVADDVVDLSSWRAELQANGRGLDRGRRHRIRARARAC